MIKQQYRDKLRDLLIPGDLPCAARLYTKETGRSISSETLRKFVHGDRQNTGRNSGAHQPDDMFRIIARVITERHEREKRLNNLAADILASTIEANQAAAVY